MTWYEHQHLKTPATCLLKWWVHSEYTCGGWKKNKNKQTNKPQNNSYLGNKRLHICFIGVSVCLIVFWKVILDCKSSLMPSLSGVEVLGLLIAQWYQPTCNTQVSVPGLEKIRCFPNNDDVFFFFFLPFCQSFQFDKCTTMTAVPYGITFFFVKPSLSLKCVEINKLLFWLFWKQELHPSWHFQKNISER